MKQAIRENVNRIIAELVGMLRPDHGWQADVLSGLKEAVNRRDIQSAEEQFASGNMWGGAGSVRDASFVDSASNARKCKLEIELVDAFASAGITNKAATEMAAIYRGWLAEGVFNGPST